MAEAVFKDSLPEHWSKADDHGRSYFRKLSSLTESRAVPPKALPVFVTFTDIADRPPSQKSTPTISPPISALAMC